MPFSDDQREENEKCFADFCSSECDRQQKLFLDGKNYEQLIPKKMTDTLEIWIDVYRGLKGQGFVIHARELRDDGPWCRSIHIGNEPGVVDKAWHKYEVK